MMCTEPQRHLSLFSSFACLYLYVMNRCVFLRRKIFETQDVDVETLFYGWICRFRTMCMNALCRNAMTNCLSLSRVH